MRENKVSKSNLVDEHSREQRRPLKLLQADERSLSAIYHAFAWSIPGSLYPYDS